MKLKAVSLFLIAMLIIPVLGGCQSTPASESSAPKETTSSQSTAAAESKTESEQSTAAVLSGVIPPTEDSFINLTAWVTKTSWSGMTELNYGATKIGAESVKATNVDYTLHLLPDSDVATAFNLKVADGDWEDLIVLQSTLANNRLFANTLVENDVVTPLDSYFENPELYPNLANIPKDVLDFWRSEDGHMYGIPSNWYYGNAKIYWLTNGYYVLPEIAEAVGIDHSTLKTTEDVKAFLVAVKEANLKAENGQDIIPLSGPQDLRGINTVLSSFGVETAGSGYAKIGGAWTHWRDDPRYKEAMQFMNELNRAGVLDPEYVSITNDMLNERLLASRVALYIGEAWPFWTNVTVGETPVTALDETTFIKAPGVDSPGYLEAVNTSGAQFIMVNKNSDVDRIMRWANNSLDTSQPRDWENIYGPVGVLWDWDDSRGGAPYFKITDEDIKNSSGDYKKMDEIGFQMGIGPYAYEYDLNEFAENNEGLAWIFKMNTWWGEQETPYYARLRPQDSVQPTAGGLWDTHFGALADADIQARAALITAADDAAFEKAWTDYMDALQLKGKWAEVNAEMLEKYNEFG